MKKKVLSIVIPMFNEEGKVQLLYDELVIYLKMLRYFTKYEIIAVNDGSKDETLTKLVTLSSQDSQIKIISLTRNFVN